MRRPGVVRSSKKQLARIAAAKRQHGCSGAAVRSAPAVERSGYRTVCVRRCDGYYFPVGFSTPKSKLERDAAVCGSFYPDGEAELYFHPTHASNEAAELVSLQGEKYAEQSFAFAYRSKYDPVCAGSLRTSDGMAPDERDRSVAVDRSAQIPFPVPRPAVTPVAATNADNAIRGARSDPAKMRVVGPQTPYVVFLADENDAVDSVSSAPKRIASAASGPSWLELIASLLSVSAQAGETNGDRPTSTAKEY